MNILWTSAGGLPADYGQLRSNVGGGLETTAVPVTLSGDNRKGASTSDRSPRAVRKDARRRGTGAGILAQRDWLLLWAVASQNADD